MWEENQMADWPVEDGFTGKKEKRRIPIYTVFIHKCEYVAPLTGCSAQVEGDFTQMKFKI